jgi:hypothetical protein
MNVSKWPFLGLLVLLAAGCDSKIAAPDLGAAGAGGAGSGGPVGRPETPSAPVSQIVTPEGGGVVSIAEGRLEGTSVSIPPGAVDLPVQVTLEEGAPIPEVSIPAGPPVQIGPSGTMFNASL